MVGKETASKQMASGTAAPAMTTAELDARLRAEFPEAFVGGLVIEEVWHGGCRLRQPFQPQSVRPGGTISGASIMALGDYAVYVAILASIGWVPLAVTTNLNAEFLRKPGQDDLVATCRLIKLGRRLAVGAVEIRSGTAPDLVAHLTATYSIPAG
jgi:uncharacterized protein (TIGR00369 family)